MHQHKLFLFCFAILFSLQLNAQPAYPTTSTLTIEQIMQGEKFVGYLPQGAFWSEDSKTIYFDWNPEMDTLRALYKIQVPKGQPEKVSVEEEKNLPGRGSYNKDRSLKVYTNNGDLYLLDRSSGKIQQITNTVDRESSPDFAADENKIVFQRSGNLYVWNRMDGSTMQLTNFRKGRAKKDRGSNEMESWLEEDQLAYFEILHQRKAVRELEDKQSEAYEPKRPLEIYYGDKRMSQMQASPDLKFVTFRLTTSGQGKSTEVPNYVTESGYTDKYMARVKVGSEQDSYELGVYDIEKDTHYIVDPKDLEGIYAKPAFLYEYHQGEEAFEDTYDSPKATIIHGPFFSEDSKAAIVVRSMDNKDRWICLLDMATGKLKQLEWQHDEAWIGGPGVVGWNFTAGTLGWLADNKHLYFQSEVTGFSHLYTVNVEDGAKKALTNGKFEILETDLSHDKRFFFISANKESPHEHHFYKMPVKGGKMERLTTMEGNNNVTLSPDEKYMLIRYSYSNKPWELYLKETKADAKAVQLTKSTTADFKKYTWRDPEIIRFRASDGASVPARIYRPENPQKNGPAVVFVHGAGYLQNVHKWWSSYYREYMFHNFLVDQGYTVLDIDYRASNGYGRNWRTAIYRHMGGKDLSDQVDGAKHLVEAYDIDPERIGIYGGSYGGFITLMAMFTAPGTFKAGAALRSVTDWAHYNHPYTSNILNTPVEDSIAYRKSSPIYHAEGLQDHLVILHGMVDRNVQFQDVVRLAQRLIELGKDNWEFAVFPMEGHGFVEPSSWADEYKRIYKIFEDNLK